MIFKVKFYLESQKIRKNTVYLFFISYLFKKCYKYIKIDKIF